MNSTVQLTFSLAELHASRSPSLDSERDWMTRVETWPSDFVSLLLRHGPVGCCGKTSPAFYPLREEEILPYSFAGWQNAGTSERGGFSTLSISEFPSADAVCLLSSILETGDVPQRCFLSAKACAGIIRRAEKRGKKLPEPLALALKAVVDSGLTLTAVVD